MSIFPRPLKRVLGKIIPFSKEDKMPTFNLGSGVADGTTVLNGDSQWVTPESMGYVPYIGATQDVDLGEFGMDAGHIVFDTTPTAVPTDQGTLSWDPDHNTLKLQMNGDVGQLMQDTFYFVKNQSGSLIPKGTVVRADGTLGASGRIKIAPFLADGTYPSKYCMGVTSEDIPDGGDGMVMHFGQIRQINLSAYTDGDILYASDTVAGGFTTTRPDAPNNIVTIAIVIHAASNGVLQVRPTFSSNINDDEGVYFPTPPTNGQVLTFNGTTALWEAQSPATGITVGTTPVTSGTDGRVFFQAGGVVQQDSSFFWDNTNKRLGIGATPSTSVRLDVRAQGALSTDIAFRVRNSADTNNLLSTDGTGATRVLTSFKVGSSALSSGVTTETEGVFRAWTSLQIGQFGNLTINQTSISKQATGADFFQFNNTGSLTASIGTYYFLQLRNTVAPTSGTAVANMLDLNLTVNQTGGANGITRGLFINPTLTSAADFRAIETVRGNVFLNTTSGNTAIGTATPNASAKLQVDSTTQGFLPPRMTSTERTAIATPAAGLIVYDTTLNKHYGYDGTAWNALY